MKLWLVQWNEDAHYDQFQAFVIRAQSEADARALACQRAEIRNPDDETYPQEWGADAHRWLDPEQVNCKELVPDGQPEIILFNYHHG